MKMSNQERLAAAFKSAPSEYVLQRVTRVQRGEDHCACGHIITERFHVVHPASKHEVILGCDCIETYTFLGNIKEQVERFLAEKKAAEKAALEVERCKELDALMLKYKGAYALAEQLGAGPGRYNVRYMLLRLKGPQIASLKTTAGKIRAVKRAIENLKAFTVKANERIAADAAWQAERDAERAAREAAYQAQVETPTEVAPVSEVA